MRDSATHRIISRLHCKYALVVQDFHTGDPIDLLRSRRTNDTEPYFTSIPIEERLEVRYLISDMYNQYIAYVEKYFPNAIPVVDSFHVIQWIVRLIDNYIRVLIKKFKQRDREEFLRQHPEIQPPFSIPLSNEVYLLQKYRSIPDVNVFDDFPEDFLGTTDLPF